MMNQNMITRICGLPLGELASHLHTGERVRLDFNMRILPVKSLFWSLVYGCLLVSGVVANEARRPTQPNVLLIVVDDLGWQDVKCYDIDEPSPMETPHMDGLREARGALSPSLLASPRLLAKPGGDPERDSPGPRPTRRRGRRQSAAPPQSQGGTDDNTLGPRQPSSRSRHDR